VEAIRGIEATMKALLSGGGCGTGVWACAGGFVGVFVHPFMFGFADCFMVGIIGS
jgi:hypothetical protein